MSNDRPLPPHPSTVSSGAMWLQDAWLTRDARWVAGAALCYALAVISATLTLHRYFSQTWDVVTFAGAARSLLGSDWTALYAQTRVEQYWPYAYPPLHALVLAPLLALGASFPDWLVVRVPPLVADIGLGLLLYTLVARKTRTPALARLTLAVWLFNPVTFYDTAVQGHFEAEWLFFIVLAYLLAESQPGTVLPTLALACAFLFKQITLLFVLPYWVWLLVSPTHSSLRREGLTETRSQGRSGLERWSRVAASGVVFALSVLFISLPFLLYSGDYIYMNLQYVADVPLQTQSWLVALTGIFGRDLFLLHHSTLLVALAAAVISWFALRRGASLYLTAVWIILAFFLLSQKVMGYYYVMLLPFALAEFIPARRFGLLTLVLTAIAWISLSPYFASWANQNHLPFYAALGTLNSLLWLALGVLLWRNIPRPLPAPPVHGQEEAPAVRSLAFISIVLFCEAVVASLLQPLVNNSTSPIRAPLVPPALTSNAFWAGIFFAVLLSAIFIILTGLTRTGARAGALPPWAYLLALFFSPLYFLTFTLTKESTAVFELVLKALGM